jgi:hypothetical protein
MNRHKPFDSRFLLESDFPNMVTSSSKETWNQTESGAGIGVALAGSRALSPSKKEIPREFGSAVPDLFRASNQRRTKWTQ